MRPARFSEDAAVAPPLPAKTASPTAANVKLLYDGLTSVIAGHPGSVELWTFYEVLDGYLGPWGDAGYPIGYGKFYCKAFNGNAKLMANANTAEWVWKTTIALQEPLRDFVVETFKAGKLGRLTEPELRKVAFEAHPQAYTDGGLAMVVLVAPELLPVIATIPGREFDPRSVSFGATVKQVFVTLGLIASPIAGNTLAGLAGPAHTGLFSRAADMDRQRFLNEIALSRNLGDLKQAVQNGSCDNLILLDSIIAHLNATQFPNQGFAATAREIIDACTERKRVIARTYRALLKDRPSLRQVFDLSQPGWDQW
jgi:hypothetical protein